MGWSFQLTDRSESIELGFVLSGAIPHVPNVPPLVVATGAAHDDGRLVDDTSGCNETLLMGTHAGSHVDGLAHVSRQGLVRGGLRTHEVQTRWGVPHLDMTTVAPFIGPGVLVDLPGHLGVRLVEAALDVGPELLAAIPEASLDGAVVLLRTGWGRLWAEDPRRYASLGERRPGLSREGAGWLADRGVRAVGTDAFTLDVCVPAGERPVTQPAHIELLMDRGVHIFEALDLEGLAARAPDRFLFVALPLRLEGATGSPVRPIAVIP